MSFSHGMQGCKILLLGVIFSARRWGSSSLSSRSVPVILLVMLQMLQGTVQLGQNLEDINIL